ncbi:hypothetical protein TrVE_jg8292 [Triparma verrucosa]|uniref:Uncharacterized protein n=1 Tax=Triparma verrucosa TaxID=1606542 RepID=A0A9W7DMG6_9STRA|nr:hypothetical protein TrVE_jg8292 [Triparma verrucosa]
MFMRMFASLKAVLLLLCLILAIAHVVDCKKSKSSKHTSIKLSPLYPTKEGTLITYTGTLSDPSSGRTIAKVKGKVLSKWINGTSFKREGTFEFLDPNNPTNPLKEFKPTNTSKPRPVNSTTTTNRYTTPIQKKTNSSPSSLISTSPHSTLLGVVTPSSPTRYEIFWRKTTSTEIKRLKLGLTSKALNARRKIISVGRFKPADRHGSRETYEFDGNKKTVRYSR